MTTPTTPTIPTTSATRRRQPNEWGRLRGPIVLCGVGFGGFFDGIVFHQILQLHHMLSNTGADRFDLTDRPVTTVAGLEVNTLWDGLFHAFTYLALLIGVVWLWKRWSTGHALRPPWRLLIGGLLVGWGLFNVIEGTINHHLLAIHHVIDTIDGTGQLVADLAFLAAGVVMISAGSRLARTPTSSRNPQ